MATVATYSRSLARVCTYVFIETGALSARVTSGILVLEYSSRGVFEKDQDDASVMFTDAKELTIASDQM